MNGFMQPLSRKSLFSALFAATVATANADIVTLNNGNSSATVDLSSQAGMSQWLINGQSQLNQQWFWYRIGNDPTGQHSIDTIGGLSHVENSQSMTANYGNANIGVQLTYTLQGGAAGGNDWSSDITENITIQNMSATSNVFHFFQYSDFALAGSPGGETASIFLNNQGFYTRARVDKALNQLSETIDQPLANEAEADLGTATLNRLNQGSPYDLNGSTGSGSPDAAVDATWALEWDFVLAPYGSAGDSVNVIKDKKLSVAPVPEPAAFSLALLGAAAFILRRKRSSA
jgi:hypothetical protein